MQFNIQGLGEADVQVIKDNPTVTMVYELTMKGLSPNGAKILQANMAKSEPVAEPKKRGRKPNVKPVPEIEDAPTAEEYKANIDKMHVDAQARREPQPIQPTQVQHLQPNKPQIVDIAKVNAAPIKPTGQVWLRNHETGVLMPFSASAAQSLVKNNPDRYSIQ